MWSNSSRCRQESAYLTRTWCLYCIIIALDIIITLCFSINCSTVICPPTVLFAFKREASSETYGPRVYFPSYKFPINSFEIFYFLIYKPKIPKISCCNLFTFILFYILVIFYIYIYQISPLQVTWRDWQPLYRVVCMLFDCLCRYWWFVRSSPTGLIPWFTNWGKYLSLLCCIILSSSREKPTQAQEVAGRIYGTVAGEIYAKSRHTKYPS